MENVFLSFPSNKNLIPSIYLWPLWYILYYFKLIFAKFDIKFKNQLYIHLFKNNFQIKCSIVFCLISSAVEFKTKNLFCQMKVQKVDLYLLKLSISNTFKFMNFLRVHNFKKNVILVIFCQIQIIFFSLQKNQM